MQTTTGEPAQQGEGALATAIEPQSDKQQVEQPVNGKAAEDHAVSIDTADSDAARDTVTAVGPMLMPAARAEADPIAPRAAAPAKTARNRLVRAISDRFRLPTPDDPEPTAARLLGLSSWAAAIGLVGLIPGARLVFEWLFLDATGAAPVIITCLGLFGMALVPASFAAIHRSSLPWYLLGFATLLLLINLALIYVAL